MSSIISEIRFTLFGSREDKQFKEKKSLLDNFIAMCSLSWFKDSSPETEELIRVIRENNFANEAVKNNQYIQALDYTDYASNIANSISERAERIGNINAAIEVWKKARNNASSRFSLICAFQETILALRNKINKEMDSGLSSSYSSCSEEEQVSLLETFNKKCGLDWYQWDSKSTEILIKIIKEYDQIANSERKSLDKKTLMSNKLDELNKAIELWKTNRKDISSRFDRVVDFQTNLNMLHDKQCKFAYEAEIDLNMEIEMDSVPNWKKSGSSII